MKWLIRPQKYKRQINQTILYKSNQMPQTMSEMITFPIDAATEQLLKDHENSKVTETMAFINSKDANGKPIRFKFECEALGEIIASEYGHSVLCRINNDEDLAMFESMEETATCLLPKTLDFKPFVKDSKFFLKLKTKDDKYRSNMDPPVNPQQLDKSPIKQNSLLVIEASPSIWANFEKSTAGLFMAINNIVIDGGKKKPVRTRR